MAFSPGLVNLDISNPAAPKEISRLDFSPPFINAGSQSLHSALPLWDRQLLFVASEASNERCNEGLNFAGLVDIKDISKPRLMSLFPLPQPPAGEPYKNFCEKGGRFGPHNVNHEIHLPDVEKPGNLIYLTYFNAGPAGLQHQGSAQPGRERLVHPAGAAEALRTAAAERSRAAVGGCARRHARLHLPRRQALGSLSSCDTPDPTSRRLRRSSGVLHGAGLGARPGFPGAATPQTATRLRLERGGAQAVTHHAEKQERLRLGELTRDAVVRQ